MKENNTKTPSVIELLKDVKAAVTESSNWLHNRIGESSNKLNSAHEIPMRRHGIRN